MTNEEAIYQLNVMDCGKTIFEEFDIKALSIAINSIQENAKLKAEIEQLKSEVEQSVNEKSEVISKIEYALNECEPIYNGCAFVPQAKPIYDLAMNYCLDLLKGQV